MLTKFFASVLTRLLTAKFLTKVMLFASEKLVKSTKVKWDDELHAIVKEALK